MKTRFTALILCLAVGVCGLVGVGCNRDITDKSVIQWGPDQIVKRQDDRTLFLDMREPPAYLAGHVPGARLTKLADVQLQSERLRFGGHSMIVVYGQNPGTNAAMAMAKRLIITKHDKVRLMKGGFDEWVRLGYPIVVDVVEEEIDVEEVPVAE